MSVSDFVYIYNSKNEITRDEHVEMSRIRAENNENWRDAQKNWGIFVKILFRISENMLEIVFAF